MSAFTDARPEAERNGRREPAVVVLSSLFPHDGQPMAGLFVRERMGRVARTLPVTFVVPVPWFPGQALLRWYRPHFRPPAPRVGEYEGNLILFPRFLSLPGVLKSLDGRFMARAVRRVVARLQGEGRADVLDAHFGYPDGDAAVRVGRELGCPVTVTFRGTEARLSRSPWACKRLEAVVRGATRVFTVSDSLRQLALSLGAPEDRTEVVANGVDIDCFAPLDQAEARRTLGLPPAARVLITVGGLCERKGQHRVIEQLPGLMETGADIHYLVVGGASGEGDVEAALREQARRLGVAERVHFLGPVPPEELKGPLSAADVFVLATRNEGWANVILEAMACGLPVVATDVGGNSEIVRDDAHGIIVPFGDSERLAEALVTALARDWDRQALRDYACANTWDDRVERLIARFRSLAWSAGGSAVSGSVTGSRSSTEGVS